ncbi:MAG: Abi family protein [Treponema sp.]|nr:Abi family protein [Treponema sp.]
MSKKDANRQLPGKKLSVPEIIDYCKNTLGITFNIKSEEEAADFLSKNNYFFRLKQYADIAEKSKTKSGKYVGVDFGHLVELSVIDMFLRKLILKMTIDFEHSLKVKLINDSQNNPDDDGYAVVQAFYYDHPAEKAHTETGNSITFYNKSVYEKYKDSPSVWSIVELLNFSGFINFYSYYYEYFNLECEYTKHFESVRRLRNSAAHNACMLCNFSSQSWFKFDTGLCFELLEANLGLSNGNITNCMKVPLLNDFTVMLSNYSKLISSPKVKEKTFEELKIFFDGRMVYHKEYFEKFTDVKNAYTFARKVLEYYSGK